MYHVFRGLLCFLGESPAVLQTNIWIGSDCLIHFTIMRFQPNTLHKYPKKSHFKQKWYLLNKAWLLKPLTTVVGWMTCSEIIFWQCCQKPGQNCLFSHYWLYPSKLCLHSWSKCVFCPVWSTLWTFEWQINEQCSIDIGRCLWAWSKVIACLVTFPCKLRLMALINFQGSQNHRQMVAFWHCSYPLIALKTTALH